jgi:hypothetical protein
MNVLRGQHVAALRTAVRLVFDAPYYVSCYRRNIPHGVDPLDHFLMSGMNLGLKPNAGFDPLIRRLQNPGLNNEDLLRQLAASDVSVPDPAVATVLPIQPLDHMIPPRTVNNDDEANVSAANSYGLTRTTRFSVGERRYSLLAPAAQMFMDRLREDRPFAFARITHGDWDSLLAYEHCREQVRTEASAFGLDAMQSDRLALRHCDQVLGAMEVYVENFLFELMDDLRDHSRIDYMLHGIAFKGYPTADERLFEWSLDDRLHQTDIERLRLFSRYFDPTETLYDATVWKRWLIADRLGELPALARDRPVIFMGGHRVATLGERWALPWFLHIPIPAEHAYPLRYQLLDACRQAIDEANAIARRNNAKRPIFILQGSSFAYWFIAQLFPECPDIFYLDFGQAIHAWFYDVAEIDRVNWGRIFGPTIVRRNGLEEFYRDRGVAEPVAETLFESV